MFKQLPCLSRDIMIFWLRSCRSFQSPFHSLGKHNRNEDPGDGMGQLPPGCSPVIPRTCSSPGRVLLWDSAAPGQTRPSGYPHQLCSLQTLPKQGRNTQFHESVKHRYAFCQAVGNEKQLKNKSPETVIFFPLGNLPRASLPA